MYPENSKYYSASNPSLVVERVRQHRLDSFARDADLNNGVLLKIDAQGAELDILKGAPTTVQSAALILLETSVLQYNKQAALASEVISWLYAAGFVIFDFVEMSRRNGVLVQVDIAFVRRNSSFFRNAHRMADLIT
ncbi:hypothetical protein CYMTET_7597 [Cymbomonas tetramitiformis]|uniref:Methyltransferase FkbM domain-containing protein n=1 Tax=Cymbomonas tetramitiformis TaxID=36881 RepID=A0AAE0GUY8_9CHLO|nr:hypothetical protein CYMTET_7597 [Cymbomonas tetramitiformis]